MDLKSEGKHTHDCMVCGLEIKYFENYKDHDCVYCHKSYKSNVSCVEGHYVCDSCHLGDASEIIENYCNGTEKLNPIEMAIELMKNPSINMHGPEHHFLVPAVLLTSLYNSKGKKSVKAEKLKMAKTRAKDVKGGFCGFYGNCGAAVGTGIYMSIISDATPLTKESWGLSNLMTGTALVSLAKMGGPRCCKRNLFTSINQAAKLTDKYFGIKLYKYETYQHKCSFRTKNKECLIQECPYF